MSRAVLVMDMPDSCMGCNFMHIDEENGVENCQAKEKVRKIDIEKETKPDWCPLHPLAIDAIWESILELERYLAIGTIEECLAAVEKQKPIKPVKTDTKGYRYTDTYRCPTCGGNFSGTGIADYCYHCGQRLDWSEVE